MSVDVLPVAVRAALNRRGAQPPLEALQTRRLAPLPSLDGRRRVAPLWLVRTEDQLWLVAAADEDDEAPTVPGLASSVGVGIGASGAARIDRAFGQSAVVVADVRASLPRHGAAAAEAMLERFSAGSGGEDYPFDAGLAEPPRPAAEPGRAAGGASEMPDGWLAAAGNADSHPWLLAVGARTEVTVAGFVRDLPRRLAIGVSETRTRVALLGGDADFLDLPSAPVYVRSLAGDRLEAPGLRLSVEPWSGGPLARLADLASATRGRRWALAAADRFAAGAPDDALELIEAALERGYEADLSEVLARLAATLDDGARAAGFLRHALARGPSPADAGDFADAVRQARPASLARARRLLELTETPAAEPIEGAPWPPRGPEAIWATAALQPLGVGLALHSIDRIEDKTRALRWKAALTQTAPAWRAAAHALRHDGRRREARQALMRAHAIEPRAEEIWRAVGWAHDDREPTEVDLALAAALELDPEAESAPRQLDADTLAALAERAAEQRLAGAGAMLERAETGRADAPWSERVDRAQALVQMKEDARAGRVFVRIAADAAASLEGTTELEELEPSLRPGTLRMAAARAFLRAGLEDAALAAARSAVADDFLHASVLREAAGLEGLPAPEPERRWWLHLAEVLEPRGSTIPGAPAVERLDSGELDALHPGGRGWLADLKTRISTPPLPARDQLIRGLERVEGSTFAELFEVVGQVCRALGLDPVPTYVYRGDDAVGVSGWPVSPPVLLVGVEHLQEGPRHLDRDALRFAVAVELAHIAAGHPVLAIDDSLLGTSKSVYQAFGRFAGTAETAVDLVTLIPGIDQLAKLQKILKLSRRVFTARSAVDKAHGLARPILDRVFPGRSDGAEAGIGHDASSRTALQLRAQADRAALMLTGDLGAAARALLATTTSRPAARIEILRRSGLGALLDPERMVETLTADEAFRLGALVEEAAQRRTFSEAEDRTE